MKSPSDNSMQSDNVLTYKAMLQKVIDQDNLVQSCYHYFEQLLASPPAYYAMLKNIFDRLYSVRIEENLNENTIEFSLRFFSNDGLETLVCAPPAQNLKQYKGWPDSFVEIIQCHENIYLESGRIFLGDAASFVYDIIDKDSLWLKLTKAKNIKCALTDDSDWYLYYPKNKNDNSEPTLHCCSHESGNISEEGFTDGIAALFIKRLSGVLGDSPIPFIEKHVPENTSYSHTLNATTVNVTLQANVLSIAKENEEKPAINITELFVYTSEAAKAFDLYVSELKREENVINLASSKNKKTAAFDHLKCLADDADSERLLQALCGQITEIKTLTEDHKILSIEFLFSEYKLTCGKSMPLNIIAENYSQCDASMKSILQLHGNMLFTVNEINLELNPLRNIDVADVISEVYSVFEAMNAKGCAFPTEIHNTITALVQESDKAGTYVSLIECRNTNIDFYLLSIPNEESNVTHYGVPGVVLEFLKKPRLIQLTPESINEKYVKAFNKYLKTFHGSTGKIFIKMMTEILDLKQ